MEKHPMRTFFLSAAVALSFSTPVFAEPVENSAICIIWDNTGKQVFGEPCTYQEWVSPGVAGRTTQLAIRDARGDISKQFSFFMNDNDAPNEAWKVDGKIAGHDIYVDWYYDEGSWYWSNGAPALSIEENESEMYD
jgi:hypothetical protein